jgi:hypothetical protein
MPVEFVDSARFSFRVRPVPVPGDMRIGWRLALIVLMLDGCRGQRASLVRLHILNDGVRSARSANVLRRVAKGEIGPLFFRPSVEPAFGRAIDLAVGSRLANWVGTTLGPGLALTDSGKKAVAEIESLSQVLREEAALIRELAPLVTEQWARALTSAAVARA